MFIFLLLTLVQAAPSSGPLKCANGDNDWSLNQDHLNSCQQYQALRQYCEPAYTVPMSRSPVLDDTCSTSGALCCCNSVAFNLAMLCLSCQQGDDIDARAGAYQRYLSGCQDPLLYSISSQIQPAVCEHGPKLLRWQYEYAPQEDGSWNFTGIEHFAQQQAIAQTTDSGHCNKTMSMSQDLPVRHARNGGAIAGAVLGVLSLLALLAIAIWWFRFRTRPQHKPSTGSKKDFDLLPSARESMITPAVLTPAAVYAANPNRPRPETQTFSELTMPVPFTIPSEYNYQTSYSGTPFSPHPPTIPDGWRNGAPSVVYSVASSNDNRNPSVRRGTASDAGSDAASVSTSGPRYAHKTSITLSVPTPRHPPSAS